MDHDALTQGVITPGLAQAYHGGGTTSLEWDGQGRPEGVVNLRECADDAGKSNGMGTHLDAQIGEQLIGWP